MVAVGDQGGAVEPRPAAEPQPRGELVAGEPDDARERQRAEVVQVLRVDRGAHRLDPRDAGADEDREDHEEARAPLGGDGAQQERDPQRDRGERVAGVVDQVGQQRDAPGAHEDQQLREGGHEQDREARADDPQPVARARDRAVDQPMAVPVAVIRVVVAVAHLHT